MPRWDCNDEITLAAYDALLQRIGECIVIGHSQGGGFALEAVRRRPQQVAAVVAIEPSGAPEARQIEGSTLPPHLVVWGDHLDQGPIWRRYRETVDGYFAALQASGTAATVCDLPCEGIAGNSHFPMLDLNSEVVAARVIDWLSARLD